MIAAAANLILNAVLAARRRGAVCTRNRIRFSDVRAKRVIVDDHAIVRDCMLRGAVSIGSYAEVVGATAMAGSESRVTVGAYTVVQRGANLFAKHHDVEIGRFCTIGLGAAIQSYNHRTDTYTLSYLDKRLLHGDSRNSVSLGPVKVGHDCLVGYHAVVMPGVTLGNGCIVLPNSVVTSSFEPYTIIAGNPAVRIAPRFSAQKVEYLQRLNWYEWPHDKIMRNLDRLLVRVSQQALFE